MGYVIRFLPGLAQAYGELVHPSYVGAVKHGRSFNAGASTGDGMPRRDHRRCMGVGSGMVPGDPRFA